VSGVTGGVPSLGGEHIGTHGGFRLDNTRFVPEEFAAKQAKGWINSGDILVVKDGATTGKVAFVGHDFPYSRALLNEHVFRCAVDRSIKAKFVFYWLHSSEGNRKILLDFRGAAQGGISRGFGSKVDVHVAPVPEQHRIVEEIDSYLTRLDDAVATLGRVQRNLKRYLASVLKAAVEGRLVPVEANLVHAEQREYEPAPVLLERILVERRRRWEASGRKGKYEEAAQPDRTELPELPKGWCWVSLAQLLAQPLVNGRSVPDAIDGFPVLRLTALKGDSIDLAERKTGRWSADEAASFLVKRGDFLVARGNGSIRLVGRGGLITVDPDPVAFPDTLIRVRVDAAHFSPRLLAVLWNSPLVRLHIEQRAKTTAGIHKVNQTDLELTPVPLPPRAEQDRLMAEVDRRLSATKEVSATVETQKRRCARLRQSILKWAFEGKLADQDPKDEPASVLLERIKAERAAATPTKTRRVSYGHAREPA